MPLDNKEIGELAHLSRIAVDGDRVERLRIDLERMMEMVRRVQELSSMPAAQVHLQDKGQRMRQDETAEPARNLADGAARHSQGFIVVPRVID